VVIPARLREQYGLDKGTRAVWTEDQGRLVLTPITMKRIKEIRGSLKPGPGEPSAFDMLFEERERERKRENNR
jgi:bifunctional DNA-binding transcriptional regulator/antitoxin component of YhaV-PrlF toxin-antitoxin module